MNPFFPLLSLLPMTLVPTSCTPSPSAPVVAAAAPIRLAADKAVLTGSTLQKNAMGATYAGDFVPEGAKMVWTVSDAAPGIYTVQIRYKTMGGKKGYDLSVNGRKSSGMFEETAAFTTIPGGKVELKSGTNTVAIERGWGYFQIDSVELTPAKPTPPLKAVTTKLSDPKATPAAQAVYDLLRKNYGKGTLSGQAEFGDTKYVRETIGETPAVQGGDFIEYSPTRLEHGSDPKNGVENMIAAAKTGQIVTMLWHWNAPSGILDAPYTDKSGKKVDAHWYFGFYTTSTTFDLEKTLAEPKSADYALMLRDMDAIAVQMKKFSDAGVPVLFRPLHEAEGGWFWWGAKGPEPMKKLWRLMYDRLTVKHNLHNLIWVYSSGTDPKWYPGDDVVDIIGIDQYPSDVADPLSTAWETLLAQYGGRKMIALTEFGGVPDVSAMERFGVRWSYFASWQGKDLGPRRYAVPDLKRLYTAPQVVNLKDLAKRKQ